MLSQGASGVMKLQDDAALAFSGPTRVEVGPFGGCRYRH